jgi:hypothetical protein
MDPCAMLVALLVLSQVPPPAVNADEARKYYVENRAKMPNTADAHWRVALWCVKHGLDTEAAVEAAATTRLDPRRSEAWKLLGYKLHRGHWMTDAMIAEEAEQLKADAHWLPALERLHNQYQGRSKATHDLADAELAKIDDIRAVPAVWSTFVTGFEGDHSVAVRVLGQLRCKASARALAALAVLSPYPETRRSATETLRDRDAVDYAVPVVALLQKPLTYRVKTFNNAKQKPELIVSSETMSHQIFYDRKGDNRPMPFGTVVAYDRSGLATVTSLGSHGRPTVFVDFQGVPDLNVANNLPPDSSPLFVEKAAGGAERRVEDDIARIEEFNVFIRQNNQRIMESLEAMSGKKPGATVDDWRAWQSEILEKAAKPDDPPRPGPLDTRFVILPSHPKHVTVHDKPGCAQVR